MKHTLLILLLAACLVAENPVKQAAVTTPLAKKESATPPTMPADKQLRLAKASVKATSLRDSHAEAVAELKKSYEAQIEKVNTAFKPLEDAAAVELDAAYKAVSIAGWQIDRDLNYVPLPKPVESKSVETKK